MARGGPLPAGHRVLRIEDRDRGRPILVDLWYPALTSTREAPHRYSLSAGMTAEDAAIAEGRHPAVVVSHGAFGSAGNYSWIAEGLARSGFVIVGVSHFGESPLYGPGTIDPASVMRPWLRPMDCSAALDHVVGDQVIGASIDASRIGALGHSSGGATVIELGGGCYDQDAMRAYCASQAASGDLGCAYVRHLPPDALASPALDGPPDLRDRRIRAIVALDPALGPGHTPDSLTAIDLPVLVVGAVENDFLPFQAHAARYGRLIRGATVIDLEDGDGQFVYLDACESDLAANGVPLCSDGPGVDRAAVHHRLQGLITAFLDEHLGGR